MKRRLLFSLIVTFVILTACAPAADRIVQVKIQATSEAQGYEAYRAMDGNPRTLWHSEWAALRATHPHSLTIDLGRSYEISGFTHLPRMDGANGEIKAYELYVSQDLKALGTPVRTGMLPAEHRETQVLLDQPVTGRYVRLTALSEIAGQIYGSIGELTLLSKGVTFRAGPESGWLVGEDFLEGKDLELQRQYLTLRHDIRSRSRFEKFAHQTLHQASLILETDRDPTDVVLRRTRVLLDHIKTLAHAPDLSRQERKLSALAASASKVEPDDKAARFTLFEKAYALRRNIAFSNPLLDMDEILFIKRHRSIYNHMCDQYYGMTAHPGGGLYILSDPFGSRPAVRDVLADSVVTRGRLKGEKLSGGPTRKWRLSFDGLGNLSGEETEGGNFLSPELSYDGKQILFAYVECRGDRRHIHHTDPTRGHWPQGRAYHIFKVNVDGSNLEQLTDGTWNDFDPCWLPNGRIAFISERRGGYLRCGRACPTYTVYDMAADGTDILGLSPHETNEWQPSVTHDGMILYTRWDYVDRHGCTVHLPWTMTPDGRDPRAVHGNFSPRGVRPDMELDLRAVPDSQTFVATAAPHHSQAFGSIVLVDPRVPDDDAMAPVKRVTPDVWFPESQGGTESYGTAWPLSETYYLCVYDAAMNVKGLGPRGNYGLYLVDAFGNKELIYRDPDIACQSPIPLRARTKPPVIPQMSARGSDGPQEGIMAVMNVYDTLRPWPKDTKIKALRVIQILPMTTPSGLHPHEVGLRLPSGLDSVILARNILGTVPVEEDGSANFIAPANVELYFQALDEQGLAVQSMRSATNIQPGERLVCQGCHEPKNQAPVLTTKVALAMQREPSRIRPDVDGTHPFSYPRLVQPVLEKHCVKCHDENSDKAPDLGREIVVKGRQKFYQSYFSLAPDYGFWNYGESLRTVPGKFGAHASKLYPMLLEGHHDLELPPEDLHRIAVWLDACSVFYGVYEEEGGRAQLRGDIAMPTLQ